MERKVTRSRQVSFPQSCSREGERGGPGTHRLQSVPVSALTQRLGSQQPGRCGPTAQLLWVAQAAGDARRALSRDGVQGAQPWLPSSRRRASRLCSPEDPRNRRVNQRRTQGASHTPPTCAAPVEPDRNRSPTFPRGVHGWARLQGRVEVKAALPVGHLPLPRWGIQLHGCSGPLGGLPRDWVCLPGCCRIMSLWVLGGVWMDALGRSRLGGDGLE